MTDFEEPIFHGVPVLAQIFVIGYAEIKCFQFRDRFGTGCGRNDIDGQQRIFDDNIYLGIPERIQFGFQLIKRQRLMLNVRYLFRPLSENFIRQHI